MSSSNTIEKWNIFYLACLTVLESMQLLIIVAWVQSFSPHNTGDLIQQLLVMDIKDLHPEREMSLFRFFIFGAIGIQAVMMWQFKDLLKNESLKSVVCSLMGKVGFLLLVQAYFILMMWVYGMAWAKSGVIIIAILSCFIQLLWFFRRNVTERCFERIDRLALIQKNKWLFDAGILICIFFIIYVPNIDVVLVNVFDQDRFYHFDSFYMSPGWAYLTQNVLNQDMVSLYSLISPIFMAQLANIAGGFDYQHVMHILIGSSILYFFFCYIFLRVWLGQSLLIVAGVLLAVKLQLFHFGVSPIIWRFPSATTARYFFDIFFFILILYHLRRGSMYLLWSAAVVVGVGLAYMLDTGMYLLASFYAYLITAIIWPNWRQWKAQDYVSIFCMASTPLLVAASIIWSFYGVLLFKSSFWNNVTEYFSFFVHGYGSLPINEYLKDKQIWAFLMGLLIPIVYVVTLVMVGSLYFLKKVQKENLIAVILSIYGLGLYHYFVNRSAMTSYYVVAIPFVFLLCYWSQKILRRLPKAQQKNVKICGLALVVFLIFANESFVNYPNYINLSHKDWSEAVQSYKEKSNFNVDVELIKRNSSEDEQIVLISSFATKMLIDSKRKPFFYYDPLITSRPMDGNDFAGGTYIHTKSALSRTIEQLEQRNPRIIFIEKKLFGMGVSPHYYKVYEILAYITVFTHQNYEVFDQGKYLLALKHK